MLGKKPRWGFVCGDDGHIGNDACLCLLWRRGLPAYHPDLRRSRTILTGFPSGSVLMRRRSCMICGLAALKLKGTACVVSDGH